MAEVVDLQLRVHRRARASPAASVSTNSGGLLKVPLANVIDAGLRVAIVTSTSPEETISSRSSQGTVRPTPVEAWTTMSQRERISSRDRGVDRRVGRGLAVLVAGVHVGDRGAGLGGLGDGVADLGGRQRDSPGAARASSAARWAPR